MESSPLITVTNVQKIGRESCYTIRLSNPLYELMNAPEEIVLDKDEYGMYIRETTLDDTETRKVNSKTRQLTATLENLSENIAGKYGITIMGDKFYFITNDDV